MPNASLDRDRLPYGVNTAVLLNEALIPVAYRMFFNHRKTNDRIGGLEIGHCRVGDSIQIDFLLPETSNESAILSASVMPFGTRAYNPDNSIVSSFLLQPYLNGNDQELNGYFTAMDRQKKYGLDLLLMVEGWGKYDWDSRTQQELQFDYAFERGFKIKGKVLDADLTTEKQVYLVTDQTRSMSFEDITANKTFDTEMLLYEKDSLGLSLVGKKGRLRKASFEVELSKKNQDIQIWNSSISI